MSPCSSLSALLAECTVGKVRVKTLEENLTSHRNGRRVYSLLAGTAGTTQHNITQHNRAQPFQAFPGEAYTSVLHKAALGQVSASWSTCLQRCKWPQLLHDHYSQNVGGAPGHAVLASLLSSQSSRTSPAPSPVDSWPCLPITNPVPLPFVFSLKNKVPLARWVRSLSINFVTASPFFGHWIKLVLRQLQLYCSVASMEREKNSSPLKQRALAVWGCEGRVHMA